MHGEGRAEQVLQVAWGQPTLFPRSLSSTDLMKNPVDGFSAGLVDDSNLFEWQVTIIGPPDTL